MTVTDSLAGWIDHTWRFIVRTFLLVKTLWDLRHDSVFMEQSIDEYNQQYSHLQPEQRQDNYKKIVLNFYNVCTLFYEWGWGPCFHFATLKRGESFMQSLGRHELELVKDLSIGPGSKVLDVGCGIGGPTRTIAKATKAHITGLNLNPMQIQKAKEMTKEQGLSQLVDYVVGDFCKMEFNDETFNAVFAVEATCHAPRREDVFGEVFRVLKKGGCFSAYEWCVTDKYDPNNKTHRSILNKIEHGNGLSCTITTEQCLQCLRNVGFEIIDSRDMFKGDKTWWTPLVGSYFKPTTFEFTPLGAWSFTKILQIMERVHLAPKGTVKISDMLFEAADGLTSAGPIGIYTPGFYFLARKPL